MRIFLVVVLVGLLAGAAWADEGMWLYNDPPVTVLQKRYGFTPSRHWLDRLRLASVRFNNGGSGAFVSPNGLVITNQHVAAGVIQQLSSQGQDLLRNGFYAATRDQELKAPDLELDVLESIQDVTKRVKSAVKPDMSDAEAAKARHSEMSTIEQQSFKKTGLRSDVITLFHGGEYQLYRYKRYTDVRLVFAPEDSIAFFGGNVDNFEYPRYCLDVAFFRVYDHGKPVKPKYYLSLSTKGARKGQLVFVSGNPGRTERLDTVANLKFLRDVRFPLVLRVIRRVEIALESYSQRSLECARQARNQLIEVRNARKNYQGELAGLQNPALMATRIKAEKALRLRVLGVPKLQQHFGDPWNTIADSVKTAARIYKSYYLLERARAFNCRLFAYARALVRLAAEKSKPNASRLREYRESNLPSLEQRLFSTAPVYKSLETVKLADSLSMFMEWEGADNPLVKKVLDGKSPRERAAQLVAGTRLDEPTFRRRLAAGGPGAIRSTDDPMIELALEVDGASRRVRKEWTDKVVAPETTAYAKIARALYATGGQDLYPDATFTLRLAFGVIKGYIQQGQEIPPFTTFKGLYQRAADHAGRAPYDLPPRWKKARTSLDLSTPLDFACTADITGGNSGSPVVNRQGQLVGVIFDGNIQSLPCDFVYSDTRARALAVDVRAILMALTRVYHADGLVKELAHSQPSPAPSGLQAL